MKGFLLVILGFLVMPLVAVYAIFGKYPWWMVTPDDPVSPFGQYEETVVKQYKIGRWWGDFYWLGLRNSLYGLKYKYKPDYLKNLSSYLPFQRRMKRFVSKNKAVLCLDGLTETVLSVGPFRIIYGYRLSPIWNWEPSHGMRPINMDGRPIFSIRLAKNA
jgi:hypothetical protein